MASYDVIMIGGGVMACSTAYHLLKKDSTINIAIIEKDPSYAQSSTVLSDGNLRLQFNIKENILMSQYGLEMLARFSEEMAVGDNKPHVSFRQQGNLFLTDEADVAAAQIGLELQKSLNCQVEWLSPDAVNKRYPFIDPKTIAGGTFGSQDGTMDPQAVLMGYKNKAIALGAEYIVGEVVDVLATNQQITGVRLADGSQHQCRYAVNSAGAWGTSIARKLWIELPVQPVKRHVFHLETNLNPENTIPLTVFPSGLYIIQESGKHFTCGKSLPDDPIGFDFTFNRQLFVDSVWEDLLHYIPACEQVKVVGGWTGLYAINTFDRNAILGEYPSMKGFMLANGFSGHGFQQCHAVGRYLAELILGIELSLDLSIFSPERISNNKPVHENPHKIV
ncbi:MAG: FAD-binding oxidoreductase [Anaerolineae bacterium]|nr:FAD-binding oxidoreductase [Anaerolineae bacterium]MDQ7036574.1 FAD-binding oxidoreductase [Anaerolineae bacterium]